MIRRLPHSVQKRLPELLEAPQRPQMMGWSVPSTICWNFPTLPIPVCEAQLGQYRESGGTMTPQLGQGIPSLAPHLVQKFKPTSLSALHLPHLIICCILLITYLQIVFEISGIPEKSLL
jgi:hypothetical protein